MTTPSSARVVWASLWPRRSFAGTVVSVGRKTAHVRLHSGRMRFVKVENMVALANTELLELGSDRALRRRWFGPDSYGHMAKCHLGLLQWLLDRYTRPGDTIGDPMAGSGSLLIAAAQQRHVILREIEPAYLKQCHTNAARILDMAGLFAGSINVGQADAREPWGWTADHLIFSPPYGCAASLNPRSRRMLPYKYVQPDVPYGERWARFMARPSAGSAGALMFSYGQHPAQLGHLRGVRYWVAMELVYIQALAALRPGGLMILVIKDHIRHGQRVPTADQTVALCHQLGFTFVERHTRRVWPLSLWQRRRQERGEPIVEEEDVLVFRRMR